MNVYITGQQEKHKKWQFNDFENLSVNIGREGEGKLANYYCIFEYLRKLKGNCKLY